MNIKDFFSYRDYCYLCGDVMHIFIRINGHINDAFLTYKKNILTVSSSIIWFKINTNSGKLLYDKKYAAYMKHPNIQSHLFTMFFQCKNINCVGMGNTNNYYGSFGVDSSSQRIILSRMGEEICYTKSYGLYQYIYPGQYTLITNYKGRGFLEHPVKLPLIDLSKFSLDSLEPIIGQYLLLS